ncbi:uncharacterized protein LOC108607768 isoform X1 [Drosophila busckii]|nr:uncharacterized protein LOC108607768 isoform X1 [Drosophila busckii]
MASFRKKRRTARKPMRRALTKNICGNQYPTDNTACGCGIRGITVLPAMSRDAELVQSMQQSVSRDSLPCHKRAARSKSNKLWTASVKRLLASEADQKLDSQSWRKLRHIDNKSGHSLNQTDRSISGYPSSWNLDEKAPDVMPDDNSLDEVINCDILNRTPYDHQLYSYVMQRRLRPTADNSCQVCMKTVVDRVFHATNTIAAQTEQADPAEFASELSIDNDDCDYSPQLIPQQRVYSGGADATSVSSASCCCLANDDELSEAESNAASKSNRYKKYGGYTPSDLSSRTSAHSIEGHVCFCDQDKFNKIQKISRPPSNTKQRSMYSANGDNSNTKQRSMYSANDDNSDMDDEQSSSELSIKEEVKRAWSLKLANSQELQRYRDLANIDNCETVCGKSRRKLSPEPAGNVLKNSKKNQNITNTETRNAEKNGKQRNGANRRNTESPDGLKTNSMGDKKMSSNRSNSANPDESCNCNCNCSKCLCKKASKQTNQAARKIAPNGPNRATQGGRASSLAKSGTAISSKAMGATCQCSNCCFATGDNNPTVCACTQTNKTNNKAKRKPGDVKSPGAGRAKSARETLRSSPANARNAQQVNNSRRATSPPRGNSSAATKKSPRRSAIQGDSSKPCKDEACQLQCKQCRALANQYLTDEEASDDDEDAEYASDRRSKMAKANRDRNKRNGKLSNDYDENGVETVYEEYGSQMESEGNGRQRYVNSMNKKVQVDCKCPHCGNLMNGMYSDTESGINPNVKAQEYRSKKLSKSASFSAGEQSEADIKQIGRSQKLERNASEEDECECDCVSDCDCADCSKSATKNDAQQKSKDKSNKSYADNRDQQRSKGKSTINDTAETCDGCRISCMAYSKNAQQKNGTDKSSLKSKLTPNKKPSKLNTKAKETQEVKGKQLGRNQKSKRKDSDDGECECDNCDSNCNCSDSCPQSSKPTKATAKSDAQEKYKGKSNRPYIEKGDQQSSNGKSVKKDTQGRSKTLTTDREDRQSSNGKSVKKDTQGRSKTLTTDREDRQSSNGKSVKYDTQGRSKTLTDKESSDCCTPETCNGDCLCCNKGDSQNAANRSEALNGNRNPFQNNASKVGGAAAETCNGDCMNQIIKILHQAVESLQQEKEKLSQSVDKNNNSNYNRKTSNEFPNQQYKPNADKNGNNNYAKYSNNEFSNQQYKQNADTNGNNNYARNSNNEFASQQYKQNAQNCCTCPFAACSAPSYMTDICYMTGPQIYPEMNAFQYSYSQSMCPSGNCSHMPQSSSKQNTPANLRILTETEYDYINPQTQNQAISKEYSTVSGDAKVKCCRCEDKSESELRERSGRSDPLYERDYQAIPCNVKHKALECSHTMQQVYSTRKYISPCIENSAQKEQINCRAIKQPCNVKPQPQYKHSKYIEGPQLTNYERYKLHQFEKQKAATQKASARAPCGIPDLPVDKGQSRNYSEKSNFTNGFPFSAGQIRNKPDGNYKYDAPPYHPVEKEQPRNHSDNTYLNNGLPFSTGSRANAQNLGYKIRCKCDLNNETNYTPYESPKRKYKDPPCCRDELHEIEEYRRNQDSTIKYTDSLDCCPSCCSQQSDDTNYFEPQEPEIDNSTPRNEKAKDKKRAPLYETQEYSTQSEQPKYEYNAKKEKKDTLESHDSGDKASTNLFACCQRPKTEREQQRSERKPRSLFICCKKRDKRERSPSQESKKRKDRKSSTCFGVFPCMNKPKGEKRINKREEKSPTRPKTMISCCPIKSRKNIKEKKSNTSNSRTFFACCKRKKREPSDTKASKSKSLFPCFAKQDSEKRQVKTKEPKDSQPKDLQPKDSQPKGLFPCCARKHKEKSYPESRTSGKPKEQNQSEAREKKSTSLLSCCPTIGRKRNTEVNRENKTVESESREQKSNSLLYETQDKEPASEKLANETEKQEKPKRNSMKSSFLSCCKRPKRDKQIKAKEATDPIFDQHIEADEKTKEATYPILDQQIDADEICICQCNNNEQIEANEICICRCNNSKNNGLCTCTSENMNDETCNDQTCNDITVLYDSSYKFSRNSYAEEVSDTDCVCFDKNDEEVACPPCNSENNFFSMIKSNHTNQNSISC